jgi:hypothetical protein
VNHALNDFHSTLCQCTVPEDIFGRLRGSDNQSKISSLKSTFRTLVKAFPVIVNVDKNENHQRNESLRIIMGFRKAAMRKIESGTYGMK